MTASGAAMAPGTRRVALRIGLVLTAAVVGILVWASVAGARSSRARAPSAAAGGVLRARLFAKVAGPAPGPFGTSLEGASFPAHGDALYFVDTTAPPGKPKILGLNLGTRRVTTTYTDSHSLLNCLVFAPQGTMYLCDLKGQRVVRFDPATRHLSTVLQGVDGVGVIPNDLAIDRAGDMYIADYRGTPTATTGRIVLRQPNGRASVLVSGLAHPNGIALTPDQNALWVTEDLAARLDHVAEQLPSPAATTPVVTVHTAAYLNLGADAYADSLTTDGHGNVYAAIYGAAEVLIFNPDGIPTGRVTFPHSALRVSHVAIQPGTRRAFVTAAGPSGGYIYTFRALAAAPADIPSGG